jgi:hypothetical protein
VIRLLIVDDYPQIRDMLATYFSEFTDEFEVIGVAGNGQEALDMIRLRQPDAVLTDIVMPVMDGITATRTIRALGVKCPIIGLTVRMHTCTHFSLLFSLPLFPFAASSRSSTLSFFPMVLCFFVLLFLFLCVCACVHRPMHSFKIVVVVWSLV